MKKYFNLQLKRAFTVLPFVMLVTVAMLIFAALVVVGFIGKTKSDDSKQRFKIALTGDTEGEYIELGMMALQNFDDTRFAMELIKMDENEAEKCLRNGKISAYVVLPENFIERAINGDTDTVTYVTSAGSETITTMFKNEITQLITDIVVYNQKGIHAIGNACRENGAKKLASKNMEALSIEYATLVFSRGELCTLEELGISEGIALTEYYICAVTLILLSLIGIGFATVYVKQDRSLCSLLASKGHGNSQQILCESASHFLSMLIQVFLVAAVCFIALRYFGFTELPYDSATVYSFIARLLLVIVTMTFFNMFMFELSENLITAVLLYFFFSLGQFYVSGCFYPVYALPKILQYVSSYLPLGAAREYLEGAFIAEGRLPQFLLLFSYTLLFAIATIFIRKYKTVTKRG